MDTGNVHRRHAGWGRGTLLVGFWLALAIPMTAQAAKQKLDGSDSCRGADCVGFEERPSAGSGSSSSGSGSSSSSSTIALPEVIDCDDVQTKDVRAVAWNIADDWENFEQKIELWTSFNLGNCTRNRFSKNGKVQCMAEDDCKKDGRCKNGQASPFKKKVKVYPTFLNQIEPLAQPDRRACYAALLTHEFAHSCDRFEGRSEAREDAAFRYWKERFPVSSGLDINEHCEMD